MKYPIVINLLAGPGAGKSTTSAKIFAELKENNINCELVTEYAKDKTWEKSFKTLKNQIYVFGKQHHRLYNLIGEVDVIITDSPLLLSIIYSERGIGSNFHNLVIEEFNKFDNYNILLNRTKKYSEKGRSQTLEQAINIDKKIKKLLCHCDIEYTEQTIKDFDIIISNVMKKIVDR